MANSQLSKSLIKAFKPCIPPLNHSSHKGQAGRIGVIGGSKEYTGAPYFAAISALKVGADLSHVFCANEAAAVIKSYSPELIVHPILDCDVDEVINSWLPRLHSLVIGPGLGTDRKVHQNVNMILSKAKEMQLPVALDAEGIGLPMDSERREIIKNYNSCILTPNIVEFKRLYHILFNNEVDVDSLEMCVDNVARELGHVTVICKGRHDFISNGHYVIQCQNSGSPRRCGGQGDVLAGAMAVFHHWSQNASKHNINQEFLKYGSQLVAGYNACFFTRECSRTAYGKHMRSTLTTNIVECIKEAFHCLYD